MPNMDDFNAFKSTNGESGGSNNGSGGSDFGCGWIAIVIVALMLISFIADGASFDAIDTLLGFGLLAFLLLRWISTKLKRNRQKLKCVSVCFIKVLNKKIGHINPIFFFFSSHLSVEVTAFLDKDYSLHLYYDTPRNIICQEF